MTAPRTRLALDIGGTKIAAGLIDAGGNIRYATQLPTPADLDPERVWAAAAHVITDVLARAGSVTGVGISCGGPLHVPDGTVSPVNIPAWRDFPIVDHVMATVPGVPVRLAGDGICMALGEHRYGAGQGSAFLLGMVVSTGVGGGLILNGEPFVGRTGNAGHVGHVVVESGGPSGAPSGAPLCGCGARGCVEAIASGPRIAAWAYEQGWRGPGKPDAHLSGVTAKDLALAAAQGDVLADRAFRRAAIALAAGIASVAAVCDLDLVVIGGGVAQAGALLFDPLRAALGSYAHLDFLTGLRVVPAALGSEAGLVGAAALLDKD